MIQLIYWMNFLKIVKNTILMLFINKTKVFRLLEMRALGKQKVIGYGS